MTMIEKLTHYAINHVINFYFYFIFSLSLIHPFRHDIEKALKCKLFHSSVRQFLHIYFACHLFVTLMKCIYDERLAC